MLPRPPTPVAMLQFFFFLFHLSVAGKCHTSLTHYLLTYCPTTGDSKSSLTDYHLSCLSDVQQTVEDTFRPVNLF